MLCMDRHLATQLAYVALLAFVPGWSAAGEVTFRIERPELHTGCALSEATLVLKVDGLYVWGTHQGKYRYDQRRAVFSFDTGPLQSSRGTLIDKGARLQIGRAHV